MSKDCLSIRNEKRIKANENEVFCLLVLGWAFYIACGSIKKPNKEPIMNGDITSETSDLAWLQAAIPVNTKKITIA